MAADGFLDTLADKYFSDQFTVTYDDIGPGAYTEDEEASEPEVEATEETTESEHAEDSN